MSFASLTSTRERILASLIDVCRNSPDLAANALGLGAPRLASMWHDLQVALVESRNIFA